MFLSDFMRYEQVKQKVRNDMAEKKCKGMRRHGGAFSLERPQWVPCKKKAVVMVAGTQITSGKKEKFTLPACMVCYQEAISTEDITITKVEPLESEE